MKFKDDDSEKQFSEMPLKLMEIAIKFAELSQQMGIEAVVTRVKDPIPGDSGVHEDGRGVDFRDAHGGEKLYNDERVQYILTELNNAYPRNDGHVTAMHHSFDGGELHFHLQIPHSWLSLAPSSFSTGLIAPAILT